MAKIAIGFIKSRRFKSKTKNRKKVIAVIPIVFSAINSDAMKVMTFLMVCHTFPTSRLHRN